MKKTVLLFISALAIFTTFSSVSLTSQKIEEADVYYVNVQILKIFVHPKGYYVIYRNLSFYIKDGKFDHIKIAAPKDLTSPVWGTLKYPADYDSKFEGVESLELKF